MARHNTPVAPSETALQAVFVAPVVLARQRRSVTPVARHRAQNLGGSGFRKEVARHNTLVAPIEPALQAVFVAPVELARQRLPVTPVARYRAQNPGGSGFREEVARHNAVVAPICLARLVFSISQIFVIG